jgi:hypothetical protein
LRPAIAFCFDAAVVDRFFDAVVVRFFDDARDGDARFAGGMITAPVAASVTRGGPA